MNGIADKVEDFVEKAHQQGKKLESIMGKIPKQCYKQQQQAIIKKTWIASDPAVMGQKEAVQKSSKRKMTNQSKTNAELEKRDNRLKRRRITLEQYQVND